MTGSLGKCSVCGSDAGVVYPLLPGSPTFCGQHHNSRDAGPFGCDFTGPDDFDIPFDSDDVPFRTRPERQKLCRRSFIWTDREGVQHKLADIDDVYLTNIVNFLEKGKGHVFGETRVRRDEVISFLRKEVMRRGVVELLE